MKKYFALLLTIMMAFTACSGSPAVDSSGLESLSQSTSSSLESMEESTADSSAISQEDIPVVAPWQVDLPENHQMDPVACRSGEFRCLCHGHSKGRRYHR